MNKILKILLAITGAVELVFNLVAPILLCVLWIDIFNMTGLMAWIFYGIGFLSSAFRGIKILVLK